jgi:2-polyprenyl-6-methoxyphenol hydroxylase-like FAD-dependent oxidoreductase
VHFKKKMQTLAHPSTDQDVYPELPVTVHSSQHDSHRRIMTSVNSALVVSLDLLCMSLFAGVDVTLESGERIRTTLLIGADGVRSRVAKTLGLGEANFAGYIAYRCGHLPTRPL